MADDVIIQKAATVERCIQRIQQDYDAEFMTNYTKQDAIILNIERACQACIDIAAHVIKTEKLGVPQHSREMFALLAANQIIDTELSRKLQGMVSFRNIAVHDYASLNLNVVVSIIEKHLPDMALFSQEMLKR